MKLDQMDQLNIHESWMRQALLQAEYAKTMGEVPVGAIIVSKNVIVGAGFNQPIGLCDPTAHAEVQALRAAALQVGNYRLVDCVMYVTLEPCTMCVGALIHARIDTLIYGASEHRTGAVVSQNQLLEGEHNHRVQAFGGVLESECRELLQGFFRERRRGS